MTDHLAANRAHRDNRTYVRTAARLQHTTSYEWNHGLGAIVTALLDAGFTLTALEEHVRALGRTARSDDRRQAWRAAAHRPARTAALLLHLQARLDVPVP